MRTLLNSGNAVGTTTLAPAKLARAVEAAIERRGSASRATSWSRTQREVAAVVAHDPLADVATDPSRYLVIFLGSAPAAAAVARLSALDLAPEEWVLEGRELYLWMPIGRRRQPGSKHLAKGVLGRDVDRSQRRDGQEDPRRDVTSAAGSPGTSASNAPASRLSCAGSGQQARTWTRPRTAPTTR